MSTRNPNKPTRAIIYVEGLPVAVSHVKAVDYDRVRLERPPIALYKDSVLEVELTIDTDVGRSPGRLPVTVEHADDRDLTLAFHSLDRASLAVVNAAVQSDGAAA